MIAHLSGHVFEIGEDQVIIDVGGVGYLLYCSARTLANLPAVGEAVSVHVETQFKAESLTLYGFEAGAERAWFRLLQTVQGVGARVALALLSALTPDQLAQAIMAKDKAAFTQASGVGPRLAQRLISELQSKVGELPTASVVTLPSATGAVAAPGGMDEDAISALINLGYGRSEAHGAVAKAAAGLDETADVEALIRAGLRELTAPLQGGGWTMTTDGPAAPDILIANGFDRYHLLTAAVEAERRDRLDRCIAGLYPTKRLARMGLGRWKRTARLMDRKVALPDERLVTMPILETAGHLGGRLLGERGVANARKRFSENARRVVETSTAALYHYRTGFGHSSAAAARRLGMATLADHSIAHPGVLAHLVQNQGRLPAEGEQGPVSLTWRDVMDDLRHADRVLVNSDFVKETFVHQGWDAHRIDVIYQGLDESFFDLLERTEMPERGDDGQLKLVFAGAFEQRKGADHLAQALTHLADIPWQLQLVGPIDEAMRARHGAFLADPRVEVVGRVGRGELAACLKAADVFLFPSLAEGSARVVFEALAAGCFVVTTRNSGSIVEDGKHGFLVQPADPATTKDALRRAHADPSMIRKIGEQNHAVVRNDHRQSGYGDALMAVYDHLLRQPAAGRREAA